MGDCTRMKPLPVQTILLETSKLFPSLFRFLFSIPYSRLLTSSTGTSSLSGTDPSSFESKHRASFFRFSPSHRISIFRFPLFGFKFQSLQYCRKGFIIQLSFSIFLAALSKEDHSLFVVPPRRRDSQTSDYCTSSPLHRERSSRCRERETNERAT